MHVKHIPRGKVDLEAIGQRIRQLRGLELTQVEFAKALGIGQTQLSRYEKGQSAPTLEILVRLSANSGKSIDWIITGSDGDT